MTLESAREHCREMVKESDRSSYVMHSYFPKPAQDAFLAIRAFNLDVARVSDTTTKEAIAKVRFDWWRSTVQTVFNSNKPVPAEPLALLLGHVVRDQQIPLSKRYMITLLQTRETYAANPPFRSVDDMAQYGEGTYSQLLYLVLEALYAVSPKASAFFGQEPELAEKVEHIASHIGEATAIASFLRGFRFYAGRRNFVPLPVNLMTQHNVSQESVLQAMTSSAEPTQLPPGVDDVVYETATRANDHVISAQTIMRELKSELGGSLPDTVVLTAMSAIPTQLFLERLEKANFNLLNPRLARSEWRLPWRSYRAYKTQAI